jgi:hypothetical protein
MKRAATPLIASWCDSPTEALVAAELVHERAKGRLSGSE